ncbi:VRR-NUC domain-containing protein [Acetobacter sp. UBA5411]|uniref:VRR-NUC domain-containing protein n=1 Tax=Acetobacter sp. UBA5411 TaxID=1945905 RepID=UPI0025BBD641|nr:VRR-NUC domain-containing protein [Acetobacter sp. UBA5411]
MLMQDTVLYPETKPRKRPQHHEDNLHTQIANALRVILPSCVVWTSTENRFNGPREGARRKARGCRAGWPDMMFCHAGRTIYAELKHGKNGASKEQRDLHAELRGQGFPVAVCRSLDEVLAFLKENEFPMRGEIAA